TGGAKGIGLAIAHHLAADGACIALLGRDDPAALQCAAAGLGAEHTVADVTDPAALQAAIAHFSPCDILVNNAGTAVSRPFLKHTAVTACQAVLPGMRQRGSGRIVNIASTAGLKGYHRLCDRIARPDG
ncbi:MAG TPA: SDR family NAD(P)-dependent oxidoreductase, partial [Acetobacteraceae bacterium]|nr:SDR family NAD(P)-dependent oxidoreductase [Acetobacteraceae bacterium]